MKHAIYYNAGAGSGKTYTLIKLLEERMLRSSNPVTPDQIILTTFTKNAASEFRDKVRAMMLGNSQLTGKSNMIQTAAIGSVDSICSMFTLHYWSLAGISPKSKVMTDVEKKAYISETLTSTVTPPQMVELKDYVDFFNLGSFGERNYDIWEGWVRAIIEKKSCYGKKLDLNNSKTQSLNQIKQIFSLFTGPSIAYNTGVIRTVVSHALPVIQSAIVTNVEVKDKQVELLKRLSYKKSYTYSDLTELLNLLSSPVDKKKTYPQLSSGEALIKPLLLSADVPQKVSRICEIIFDIAISWEKKYADFKREHNVVDYSDMEQFFCDLLDKKLVIDEIKSQYRLLMVDEFQDTNPIQLEIFEKLSTIIAEAGGETILVGDSKQSIYGFRGADKTLIDNTISLFRSDPNRNSDGTYKPGTSEASRPDLELRKLDTSWRSVEHLVNLSNGVFSKMFGPNAALNPHRQDFSDEHSQLWYAASDLENHVASKIQEIVKSKAHVGIKGEDDKQRQVEYGDFAILCKSNAECAAFASALRSQGIPVASSETDILQRIEVHLLIELLRYVDDNNYFSKANLYRLLEDKSTEFVLEDKAKFDNGSSAISTTYWLDSVKDLDKLISFKGMSVSELCGSLIDILDLENYVAKWGDRVSRTDNLRTMKKLTSQYEECCQNQFLPATVHGFIRFISNVQIDRSFDNTANAVKVLTYHGSKGLEWPWVIMASTIKNTMKTADEKLQGVNYNDSGYITFLPQISNGKLDDDIKRGMATLASAGNTIISHLEEREKADAKNLLYVGVTRARDFLAVLSTDDQFGVWEPKWLTSLDIDPKWYRMELELTQKGKPRKDKEGNLKYKRVRGWVVSCGKTDVWDCEVMSAYKNIAGITISKIPEQSVPVNAFVFPVNSNNPALFTSPSQLEKTNGSKSKNLIDNVKVSPVSKLLDDASKIQINNQKGDIWVEKGDCIHHIFAAFKYTGDVETDKSVNKDLIQSTIRNAGLTEYFNLNPATEDSVVTSFVQSFSQLRSYLCDKYAKGSNAVHKELREHPILYTLKDTKETNQIGATAGQVLRGNIDLVWFAENEDKEVVLIDYKSFTERIYMGKGIHYVGNYAPQQLAYKVALENSGYKVKACLIYYAILGDVVELKF